MLTSIAVKIDTVSFGTGCVSFKLSLNHHLQGYLNFLSLKLNTDNWFEKIVGTDFYR